MKDLASPFDRIPVELIQEIFISCLPELDYNDILGTTRECWNIVKKISLICKEWYEIAITTPELWTYITIAEKENHSSLQLRRSLLAPLCATEIIYHESLHRSLFSDAQISRWKAIHVLLQKYPAEEIVKLNNHFEGKSAPHLEMLSFSGKPYAKDPEQLRGFAEGVLALLSTSSKVKYFSWTNLPLPIPSPSPVDSTGLSRLTTVILNRICGWSTADDYIRFISMCKSAKSIQLSVSFYQVEDPMDSHPITVLPFLEELTITNIRIGAFLPHFTLPKLKKLEMRVEDMSDYEALNQCYQRSSFLLVSLEASFWSFALFANSIAQYLMLPWVSSIPKASFGNICQLHRRVRGMREIVVLLRSFSRLPADVKCKLSVDRFGRKIGWESY